MTEKFAIDGACWYCTTVHRHVFLVLASAVVVNDSGENLLTRTALADNQHREVDGCHLQRLLNGSGEKGRFADDAKSLLGGFNFFAQCGHNV